MRLARFLVAVLALAASPLQAQTLDADSCARLASLTLKDAALAAELVAAGAFKPPTQTGAMPTPPEMFAGLPAFCRITGTLTPSPDSDIRIEVWLPASGWNGKLQGVGNGGWAGSIFYMSLSSAVQAGYAVVATDTGHAGGMGDGRFAFNHPEKLLDFGSRAVHDMTVQAKAIVAAAYGSGPRLSYWNGCSTGGRQGLMEAQRYPADYDGVLAGAPANYMTHLATQSLWVAHATLKDPASHLSPKQFAALHAAALAKCDALDGVTDGVLNDPRRCKFDPASIACPEGTETDACLTPPQVRAARMIYSDATNPRTGEVIFPGFEPSSEKSWGVLAGGPGPLTIADDYFKYLVFKNPDWDYRTLDFDKDVAKADAIDNGELNAIDPNLTPFFNRGGRLILYHGWTDGLISPRNTVNYYGSVVKALGPDESSRSMRLFMVPGMDHCFGGDGPFLFDGIGALDQWVDQKKAPERIVASHMAAGKADRTRPLCAYPQVAVYTGTGSTDDEANFVCKAP